jgi:hypothetical protein
MRRLAGLLLLALVAAGRGGSRTTQAESAGGTVDALRLTCAGGRPRDSLELLSPPAKDFLVAAPSALRGCLDLLGLRSGAELRSTRVVSTHANDLSATVELLAPDGGRSHVELEKSRGEWAVTHPAQAMGSSP